MQLTASIRLTLDRTAIARLVRLGYLHQSDLDPASIRDAAAAALATALAPAPMPDARAA